MAEAARPEVSVNSKIPPELVETAFLFSVAHPVFTEDELWQTLGTTHDVSFLPGTRTSLTRNILRGIIALHDEDGVPARFIRGRTGRAGEEQLFLLDTALPEHEPTEDEFVLRRAVEAELRSISADNVHLSRGRLIFYLRHQGLRAPEGIEMLLDDKFIELGRSLDFVIIEQKTPTARAFAVATPPPLIQSNRITDYDFSASERALATRLIEQLCRETALVVGMAQAELCEAVGDTKARAILTRLWQRGYIERDLQQPEQPIVRLVEGMRQQDQDREYIVGAIVQELEHPHF